MDETNQDSKVLWNFIHHYFGRIVVGVILIALVYGVMLVMMPYRRERRIGQEFISLGFYVNWNHGCPDWIPQPIRDHVRLFNRIYRIGIGPLNRTPDF